MGSAVQSMLHKYDCKNIQEQKNALKEIVQEIALCGLARGGFFREVAFYGGTALRIFHGLDRFSEDMDFSLLSTNMDFSMKKYFPYVEKELAAYGFKMEAEEKNKTNFSAIRSAFLKGDTNVHLINIMGIKPPVEGTVPNEQIKIKLEIDTCPPEGADFEIKYALLPVPFAVRLYDDASLFAGKIHAVLCRKWSNRVKGRDFYDYLWYVSHRTKVNVYHLQKRMEQSGHWDGKRELTIEQLKELLMERFETVDYKLAKNDIRPFIKDSDGKLEAWGKELFCQTVQLIKDVSNSHLG